MVMVTMIYHCIYIMNPAEHGLHVSSEPDIFRSNIFVDVDPDCDTVCDECLLTMLQSQTDITDYSG